MIDKPYSPGLAGVIAGETAISSVGPKGLTYRGYPIQELAERVCFEEVAHLLIYGELPNRRQLSLFRNTLMEYRRLPLAVLETLRTIPTDIDMMDVLRTTVSMAGHFDPTGDGSIDDLRRRSIWLISTITSLITARCRFVRRMQLVEPQAGLSQAGQILYQFQGREPAPEAEKLIDLTLILYADHALDASTFASRVVCSTRSDMVSAIVGAIAAFKGSLDGGAVERAMDLLGRFASAEAAGRFVHGALQRSERIAGFGHPVYKNGDPRAQLLEGELRRLADQKSGQKWLEIYDALQRPMVEEKGIHPNLDLVCAVTCHALGLPRDMSTPLLAASRMAGWCAHFIEQVREDRLFQPLSHYVGEPVRSVPALEG